MRVGPEVFAPVLSDLSGGKHPWKPFVFQNDEGICFVVFELDVVDGLVLLDHVVFEQQGIGFARCDNPLHISNLFHQQSGFAVVVLFGEVAGHPLFQVFGLADVQQFTVSIKVLINAGLLGHSIEDCLDVLGGRHR